MDITIAGSDVVSDENREERTAGHLWGVRSVKRQRRSTGIRGTTAGIYLPGVRGTYRGRSTLGQYGQARCGYDMIDGDGF